MQQAALCNSFSVRALDGIPFVRAGDDVAGLVIESLERDALSPGDQDILVVAHKIVSKAEGRVVRLADVTPSAEAIALGGETGKDARQVELILAEAETVLRHKPGVIVAAHRCGVVLANAGIDRSNVGEGKADDADQVLLLPQDPEASAAAIKARLDAHFSVRLGVIISDSAGRAWRLGTTGLAIGAAGVPSLLDLRGHHDLFGRELEISMNAFADSVAAAAVLAMGEGAEGRPVALVQGLRWAAPELPAAALVRPVEEDLFR